MVCVLLGSVHVLWCPTGWRVSYWGVHVLLDGICVIHAIYIAIESTVCLIAGGQEVCEWVGVYHSTKIAIYR